MMKKYLKFITCLLAIIFLITACEENAIDSLTGKYPPPENYTLTKLLVKDVQKNERTRTVKLVLSTDGLTGMNNGSGNYLQVEFLVSRTSYYLNTGSYTIASITDGKAGNYVSGYGNDSGTYWYNISGGSIVEKQKIMDGMFSVKTADERYTISGTLLLENNSIIKIEYSGNIVFEIDPPSYTYYMEISKPYAYTQDGTSWTVVDGSQLNTVNVYSDGALTTHLEIVTAENPTSLTGNYSISDPITGFGQIVIGSWMNLSWFGAPNMVIEGGSYLIGDDGVSKLYIRGGNIAVTDNAGVLTITGNSLPLQDINVPYWGTLPTPGSLNIQEATKTESDVTP